MQPSWRQRWPVALKVIRLVAPLAILVAALWPTLTVDAVPLEAQPGPDAPSYALGAISIANGVGFRIPYVEDVPLAEQPANLSPQPSRYPPGFPLALAPFVEFGGNDVAAAQFGARMIAAGLVLATFTAGWLLGGPIAAAVAGVLLALSPFVERSGALVMSDASTALLTMVSLIALALAVRPTRSAVGARRLAGLAGLAAGYGVMTRFSLLSVLAALVIVLVRHRLARYALIGALGPLIMLGTYQWTEFGHPLRTGYDYHLPGFEPFDAKYVFGDPAMGEAGYIFPDRLDGELMGFVCPCDQAGPIGELPNWLFYPAALTGLYWIYFPPLLGLIGMAGLIARRRSTVAQFAILGVACNTAIALPYLHQGARLVAPAAFLLLVAGSVCLAECAALVKRRIHQREPRHPSEPPVESSIDEGALVLS